MNILVIEDDPVDRKLAVVLLKTDDHAVREYVCAEDAMEAMTADKPELILLDLRLPGMDGLALVRQLKANPETRDIPIIVMTAFPERFKESELLAAGCAAYLAKPINTRTLSQRVLAAVKGNFPAE